MQNNSIFSFYDLRHGPVSAHRGLIPEENIMPIIDVAVTGKPNPALSQRIAQQVAA